MLDLSFEFSNYSKEKIELKKHCAARMLLRALGPRGAWGDCPTPQILAKISKTCSIKVHIF
jgi:hypothetical protein